MIKYIGRRVMGNKDKLDIYGFIHNYEAAIPMQCCSDRLNLGVLVAAANDTRIKLRNSLWGGGL